MSDRPAAALPPWQHWLRIAGLPILLVAVLAAAGWWNWNRPPAAAPAVEGPAAPVAQPSVPVEPAVSGAIERAEPVEQLAAILEQLPDGVTADSANATLFGLWGATYRPGPAYACQQAEAAGLRCLLQRGTLDEVRTLNMPVILNLRSRRGIEFPVVLAGLQDGVGILVVAGREHRVEAAEIADFWQGEYLLLWRPQTSEVKAFATKEMVAEVLSTRYRTLKSPGNLNNEIGLPLTILRLSSRHQRAVMEMGFYIPGEIAFLCEIAQPQVGVLTNIGTVQAERAGSQEAIARGKAELVQALPPAPEGVAILNFDDPWIRIMEEKTRARVFFYGLSQESHLWADQVVGLGLEGIRFRLHYRRARLCTSKFH